jgi:hypothetical protein
MFVESAHDTPAVDTRDEGKHTVKNALRIMLTCLVV